MKSVLITGGTGTLGNGIVEKLLLGDECRRICILSRGEKDQAAMARKFASARLRFFVGDVRDYLRVRRAMDGCEVIIHAAALKRIEVGVYNPDEMVKTNVLGTANVVEAAREIGVKRCILISSDKAYEPVSPYGYSKALAECLFTAAENSRSSSGPRYAGVRYGNVWCSAGSVVPLWRSELAAGRRPIIREPECTRFFMLLSEAVDFVLGAIERMQGGEIFVPDNLPAYKLGDLACAMMTGKLEFPPDRDPNGLPAYEKLHESMQKGMCSKDARRMSIEELRSHLPPEESRGLRITQVFR